MKQLAVLLIALSVTLNVAVPRPLDAMASDDIMAQAMRCQSVLLCYSFFSTVPITMVNALFAGQSGAAGQEENAAQPEQDRTTAAMDLSVPGTTALVKTAGVLFAPPAGAVCSAPRVHAIMAIDRARWLFYCAGWSSALHQLMVMLPRGSIDDHMQSIILNVDKPIGMASQLAFSLGGTL